MPAASHVRVAIDSAAKNFSQTPGRGDFVILPEWQHAKLRELKTANPKLKVLMYKNLSAMMSATGGDSGTGVTTQEAAAHPEWYLLNTAKQRFTFGGYGYLWAADIGNPSYQARWLANVKADLQADQWDGVFIDDANPTIKYHYKATDVPRYPNDAAYAAATGSMLAAVGPSLQSNSKLVIGNFADWRSYRATVGKWLPSVSGGMEEHFTKYGDTASAGYLTGIDWDRQLEVLKQTQAAGKYLLGVSHSTATDSTAARYGWATMLLAGTGKASFSLAANYSDETWFPEYDYDLGKATGVETTIAGGVHRRTFERGIVLVNPKPSTSVAVNFGGRYRGSGLSTSSSTVMAPHTGLILLDASVAAPTAPAAPVFQAVVAPLKPAASTVRADTPPAAVPAASRATVTIPRNARKSLRVRVICRSKARPCKRLVTVVLRHKGKRAKVGQRKVTLRRTARISVRLDAKGRAALAQGRRLQAVVRGA